MAKQIGHLIVFDGSDGCGKSSQIDTANEFLKQLGFKTLVTREPGSQHIKVNQTLRQLVKHEPDLSPVERELLFMADAARHKRFIEEEMYKQPGLIVLCDRGYYSHINYQKATHLTGLLTAEELKKLSKLVEQYVIKPDFSIIFKADYLVAKARMEGREGGKDVIESLGEDFLKHVNNEYSTMKKGHKVFILDANKNLDEVTSEVQRTLLKIVSRVKNG